MRRMFQAQTSPPDVRPAMLSIVSLMVLLLPMLLMTTSAQKLTGLAMGLPGPSEELPPEPPGPVESLTVVRVDGGYQVQATVRSTDVNASVGDTETKSLMAGDLSSLQGVLAKLKKLDPKRDRITLAPSKEMPTDEVVQWMDAVRAGPEGPLYPRIVMQAVQ